VRRLREALERAEAERSSAVRQAEDLQRDLDNLRAAGRTGGPNAFPRRHPGSICN